MLGWLVVNGFIESEKFKDIYYLLTRAAEKRGVRLLVKKTTELSSVIGDESVFFPLPDFALFWDKDVVLAERMEEAGIKVYNSSSAIKYCDNKILTAQKLFGKVAIPRTLCAPKTFEGVGYNKEFIDKAIEKIRFPMVVKEAFGSFGKQVYLAENREEFEDCVKRIGFKDFLVQEFIQNSYGRDVRVYVVGGKVACRMLRVNERDFRSNVTGGGSAFLFGKNDEIDDAAVRACAALGLDFGGVDVLFGVNGPLICEVNSNPHFRSALQTTGVDLSEKIIEEIVCLTNGKKCE